MNLLKIKMAKVHVLIYKLLWNVLKRIVKFRIIYLRITKVRQEVQYSDNKLKISILITIPMIIIKPYSKQGVYTYKKLQKYISSMKLSPIIKQKKEEASTQQKKLIKPLSKTQNSLQIPLLV